MSIIICYSGNWDDYHVGITVINNPGSNFDIDNKSNPDLVPLHMLSDCFKPRFHQHLADQFFGIKTKMIKLL